MKTRVLVDTSVWIDHLHSPVGELVLALESEQALSHSAVLGELACGRFKNRDQALRDLRLLEPAREASSEEALALIETHHLAGSGLGWVDVQLLASSLLSDARLLTHDRTLARFARTVLSE